jgi:hypothetical protein
MDQTATVKNEPLRAEINAAVAFAASLVPRSAASEIDAPTKKTESTVMRSYLRQTSAYASHGLAAKVSNTQPQRLIRHKAPTPSKCVSKLSRSSE